MSAHRDMYSLELKEDECGCVSELLSVDVLGRSSRCLKESPVCSAGSVMSVTHA